jgi:putative tryptophan/tyrosine transport system substrate-binding protein
MRRRDFIKAIAGSAAAWPFAARAQQSGIPVVGVLSGGPRNFQSFTNGISEAGYEDGRNVRLEFHSASGRYEELQGFAQELVNRRVALIAAFGINAAQAVKEMTSSIPIVFVVGVDPIKFGFVRSLNHPGANITGMSLFTSELHGKRVDLLSELVPPGTPIGMIINPKMPDTDQQVKEVEANARAKAHSVILVKAGSEDELNEAFAALAEHHVAGILAVSDNFLYSRRDQIIALAARYSIPMMHPFRADAAAGGLLSYGTNWEEMDRQAGIYAGRVLKGEKAGDLPVQQPSKFDLVLNLKTAKALGLTFPTALLVRADEVIE